jgi:hypothetical protein
MSLTIHQDKQPLQGWVAKQVVGDEMLWKGAFGEQIEDMRGLHRMFSVGMEYDDAKNAVAYVVSEHRSKSITLPVVTLERPDLGIVAIVRNNFYNWKLSVISNTHIDDPVFPYLFHTQPPIEPDYTGNPLADCYFEGFPRDLIFGYHCENMKAWSAEIHGICTLKHVLFLCLKAVGAVRPLVWNTKVEHRAKLDEESRRWKERWEREKALEKKNIVIDE